MENKFKMYVVTHKKIDYKLIDNYVPIQVGKIISNLDLPYTTDNTGKNISSKNKNYCELTALYWIWKNVDLPDYVGVCHYRRFFVYGIRSKLIDEKKVLKLMEKYDVILPYPSKVKEDVYHHFINSTSGREKDLLNLKKIIEEEYPEYSSVYEKIMSKNKISYCNMVIMSKRNYCEYCEWLFDILFKLEKITNMSGYSKQEQRLYGFLSEFLLNVWIEYNQLNTKYCNRYFIEDSKIKNGLKKIKLGIRSFCHNV